MQSGRRTFLKKIGGFLIGLTAAGKLKAQETKNTNTYVGKYRKNSIPLSSKAPYPYRSGVYACSGVFLAGVSDPDSFEKTGNPKKVTTVSDKEKEESE